MCGIFATACESTRLGNHSSRKSARLRACSEGRRSTYAVLIARFARRHASSLRPTQLRIHDLVSSTQPARATCSWCLDCNCRSTILRMLHACMATMVKSTCMIGAAVRSRSCRALVKSTSMHGRGRHGPWLPALQKAAAISQLGGTVPLHTLSISF